MKRLARILFLAAVAASLALPVGLATQAASQGTESASRTTLETDDLLLATRVSIDEDGRALQLATRVSIDEDGRAFQLATRVSIDEDGRAFQLATRVSIDEDGRSLISQPRSPMVA